MRTGKNTGNFMHFVCAFLKPVAVGASFCSAYALGANARLEIKQGIFRDVSGNLIRLSGNSCGRIREFLRRAFWPLHSSGWMVCADGHHPKFRFPGWVSVAVLAI